MSKSLGNYIGIDEPANEIYGKTMSLPDSQILPYSEYLTDVVVTMRLRRCGWRSTAGRLTRWS